jgi:hypothetical protein
VPNVVDQLESHGKTWTAYMQSYALCNGNALAHACGDQLYERKHNPFISYADVQSNPSRRPQRSGNDGPRRTERLNL